MVTGGFNSFIKSSQFSSLDIFFMTKMLNLNLTQKVQRPATEGQLSTTSEARKMFVQEILEKYRKEEQILKSCAELYDEAFCAVYHGPSARTSISHAQFRHGLMEALRAKEKLQGNEEFQEAGFMWWKLFSTGLHQGKLSWSFPPFSCIVT